MRWPSPSKKYFRDAQNIIALIDLRMLSGEYCRARTFAMGNVGCLMNGCLETSSTHPSRRKICRECLPPFCPLACQALLQGLMHTAAKGSQNGKHLGDFAVQIVPKIDTECWGQNAAHWRCTLGRCTRRTCCT